MERIVITGIGGIAAIGNSADEIWEAMLASKSGTGPITHFDASEHLVKVACEVKDFDPESVMERREVRRRDPYEHFAATAVKQAMAQSGIGDASVDPSRVGVVISSGVGGLTSLEENVLAVDEEGPRKANPFLIPMLMSNGAAGLVGIDHGFQGTAFSVASACASGQDGIGMAWLMLRAGMLDAAIAGASEAPITPTAVAAFDRIQAMSRRELGEATPSPFSAERDGLVVGEGAGILVLETETHARQRGATILAELAGYASTADAFHITAPAENGEGGSRAMLAALKVAGANKEDVDYINAHGTGTPLNDKAETVGIKAAFGEHAYDLTVSSTKSMTGHMMGATGALECAMLVKAVTEDKVPPTIHFQTPDPELDLDYIPNEARDQTVNLAISNAFGFGGHNAVIAIRKYS